MGQKNSRRTASITGAWVALHDCLGEITTPTIIKVPKELADGTRLGAFGARLLKVLRIAAEENSALQLRMLDK